LDGDDQGESAAATRAWARYPSAGGPELLSIDALSVGAAQTFGHASKWIDRAPVIHREAPRPSRARHRHTGTAPTAHHGTETRKEVTATPSDATGRPLVAREARWP